MLTADHGYHLGELAQWSKHTVFEDGVHVPLIIRAPWIAASAGRYSESFAELVDLYPTCAPGLSVMLRVDLAHQRVLCASRLASLANLPPPPDVEGTDLSPAIRDSQLALKTAAYSQYPRCPKNFSIPFGLNYCESIPAKNFFAMGLSVRTADARYTEWRRWDGAALRPRWDPSDAEALVGVELYLHDGDSGRGAGLFDRWETENAAGRKASATLEARHRALLRRQFGPKGAA